MNNQKGKINILFDIKVMGINFLIPIVIYILTFMYLLYISSPAIELKLALPIIEFIITPFSFWWTIYLFYDYFERNGAEILLHYPISIMQHGFYRILTLDLFYIFIICSLALYISLQTGMQSSLYLLLLQYIPQTLFFSGLGFFLMTLFKNIGISITVVAFYISTEFLTQGQLIPWYHAFFFNDSYLTLNELLSKSILNIIFFFLFVYVGGHFLNVKRN